MSEVNRGAVCVGKRSRLIIHGLERICMTSLYVSLTSFFASKVDESIGASYMALLWTITNMSGLICDTGAMWLTGKFEDFSGHIPNWDAYHYVLALLTIIRFKFNTIPNSNFII